MFVAIVRRFLHTPNTKDPKKLLKHLEKLRKEIDGLSEKIQSLKLLRKRYGKLAFGRETSVPRLDSDLREIYEHSNLGESAVVLKDLDIKVEPIRDDGIEVEWYYVGDDKENFELKDITKSHRIVLTCHGGGYFMCSTKSHRNMACDLSRSTNALVFSVNYRLAPEFPFPCKKFFTYQQ